QHVAAEQREDAVTIAVVALVLVGDHSSQGKAVSPVSARCRSRRRRRSLTSRSAAGIESARSKLAFAASNRADSREVRPISYRAKPYPGRRSSTTRRNRSIAASKSAAERS